MTLAECLVANFAKLLLQIKVASEIVEFNDTIHVRHFFDGSLWMRLEKGGAQVGRARAFFTHLAVAGFLFGFCSRRAVEFWRCAGAAACFGCGGHRAAAAAVGCGWRAGGGAAERRGRRCRATLVAFGDLRGSDERRRIGGCRRGSGHDDARNSGRRGGGRLLLCGGGGGD